MHQSVKEFLMDHDTPYIGNRYFEEIYYQYSVYARAKEYYPVSKNKFSRDIRKWGFTTIVCRDYFTKRCKRVIILPEEVKLFIQSNNINK